MACVEHQGHTHQHGTACGHQRIRLGTSEAYLHDGHLHTVHGGHIDEASIAVSDRNPAACNQAACAGDHAAHPAVPHGDHLDVLIAGRLHHDHAGHCDDHGPVELIPA